MPGQKDSTINAAYTTICDYDDDPWVVPKSPVSGGTEFFFKSFTFADAIDEVLMMRRQIIDGAGTDFFYGHDHLYSPVALFDASGEVWERYEYDAYGAVQVMTALYAALNESCVRNNIAFTGRELDLLDRDAADNNRPRLKLMHYRARSYAPQTGRFMQRDPLGINPVADMMLIKQHGYFSSKSTVVQSFEKVSMLVAPHTSTIRPAIIIFVTNNPFSFQRIGQNQYSDGMNTYQYCRSNSIVYADPHGLKCRMTPMQNLRMDTWWINYQDALHAVNPNDPSSEERKRRFFEEQPLCPGDLIRFKAIKISNNSSEWVPPEMVGSLDITVWTWCAKCELVKGTCCAKSSLTGQQGVCRKITVSKYNHTVDLDPKMPGVQKGETLTKHDDSCGCSYD